MDKFGKAGLAGQPLDREGLVKAVGDAWTIVNEGLPVTAISSVWATAYGLVLKELLDFELD